jgi:hypothetical protein
MRLTVTFGTEGTSGFAIPTAAWRSYKRAAQT